MDIVSFIWYNFTLVLALLFVLLFTSKRIQKSGQVYLLLSFVILLFFSGCRFFVGNDYSNYVEQWWFINDKGGGLFVLYEPLYYLLCRLLSFSKIGYLGLFFISSFITLLLIFKCLYRKHCLFWGVFSLYVFGFLEFSFDVVRQGISIAIFIYSIKYLENNKYVKYSLCILIAAGFHYSALVLLLLYFVRKVILSTNLWMILILLGLFVGIKGYASGIISTILMNIPYFGEAYQRNERLLFYLTESEELGSGLGILFIAIQGLFVTICLKTQRILNDIYVQLFLLGTVLLLFTTGFYLANRIASYMFYINILVLPKVLNLLKSPQKIFPLIFIIGSFLFFSIQILGQLDRHGMTPYRNIITQNIYSLKYLHNQDTN